jgi:hypothetical protein
MGKATEKSAVVYVWNELTSVTQECTFAKEAVKNVFIMFLAK